VFIFIFSKEKITFPKLDNLTGLFTKIFKSPEKKIILTLYKIEDPIITIINDQPITFYGICNSSLRIGKTFIHLSNYNCTLSFGNASGKITILPNLISFELTSSFFELNGIKYQTEEKINGNVIPIFGKFYVKSNNFQIKNINAKLEIYTTSEKPSLMLNFPPCEYLELTNYNGVILVTNTNIVFDGSSSGKYRCQNVENKI